MIFSENPTDRMYEWLMQEKPRYYRHVENEKGNSELPASAPEVSTAAEMLQSAAKHIIPHAGFHDRLKQYLCESEGHIMFYKSKSHRQLFETAIGSLNYIEPRALAAIYLMTADTRLWSQARHSVSGNNIAFGHIHLTAASPEAYTLFVVARDLYSGTRRVKIEDIADKAIVPAGVFAVICNALAVCRYGMNAAAMLQTSDATE